MRKTIWSAGTLGLVWLAVACSGKKHPAVTGDVLTDAGEPVVCGSLGCAAPPPDPPTMPIHVGSPCDGDPGTMDAGLLADDGGTGEGGTDAGGTDAGGNVLVMDSDAVRFAKSIGICTTKAKDGYGLVSATFTSGFGANTPPPDGQWGMLKKFGALIKPREGDKLGVLSTGYAQEYDTPDGTPGNDFVQSSMISKSPAGTAPPDFPKGAAGCPVDNRVNNVIDVHLVLKAPSDATGFQFDFDFYTSEWPEFLCSQFNDSFVAYLTSKGKTDNVSFDSKGNPVSVNNGFFDRCTAGVVTGCSGTGRDTAVCAAGTGELMGTGYSGIIQTRCTPAQSATDGGATGWLSTHAPIAPGEEFTLDLIIWNTGDTALDSSVLLDNWKWLGGTVTTGTTRVK
jgi:hypothetical protein